MFISENAAVDQNLEHQEVATIGKSSNFFIWDA